YARKCPDHHLHDGIVDFIDVEPLRHDPARFQPPRRQFVKFAAEYTAHTDHPWIRRLGDYHIVLLRTEFEHRTRILLHHLHSRAGQHSVVPRLKKFCCTHYRFAILGYRQAVDIWMTEHRPRSDPAAQSKYEHVLAVRLRHQRQMGHQRLRGEIATR